MTQRPKDNESRHDGSAGFQSYPAVAGNRRDNLGMDAGAGLVERAGDQQADLPCHAGSAGAGPL